MKKAKFSKSFDLTTAFNPKYNFIVVIVKKNREVGYMYKSASYDNCYKQLLFWQSNYAYPEEVQEFTIDQLV
jgi:hypothetical protein